MSRVVRVAAVGDVHIAADAVGHWAPGAAGVGHDADVLLLAGDLTKCGTADEAALVVAELRGVDVPVVAVLGNHDHESDRAGDVAGVLRAGGVTVLDGDAVLLDVGGVRLGVAGVKGFGGGFSGASASAFGEAEMKAFVRHTEVVAASFDAALTDVRERGAEVVVALTHYSPTPETLAGERLEIYPFLGCHQLGRVVDAHRPALALHGHAHAGTECGTTPGGVPVRNVAMPVIRHSYRVYALSAP